VDKDGQQRRAQGVIHAIKRIVEPGVPSGIDHVCAIMTKLGTENRTTRGIASLPLLVICGNGIAYL